MKKLYLLLLAFVAMVTTANAGVVNLINWDFEAGGLESFGWQSPNRADGMSIGGDQYGQYFQFSNMNSTGGRNCFTAWGSDIYTDKLKDGVYHVEFEWTYSVLANNKFDSEISVFSGDKPAANNSVLYEKDNTLFSITESADNHSLFFVNKDKEQTFGITAGEWFAILLDIDVNARTVAYKVVDQNTRQDIKAEGVRVFDEGTDMLISGLNINTGRYTGAFQIDNIKVQVITAEDFANVPSVALTGVNGTERTYTIAFLDGETLHVKGTDGEVQDIEFMDCDGAYKYSTSTSGTLEAWTTSGNATSDKVSVEVECNVISLPAAVAVISNASAGYAKSYTLTVDNSEVPTKPQIYISYTFKDEEGKVVLTAEDKFSGEVVSVESKGTLTVNTTAPGFGTTTIDIVNNQPFVIKHDVDFQHMTGEELAAKGFEKQDDLDTDAMSGENNWTGRMYMYYKLDSGEKDDDQNTIWTNVPVYGPSAQGYEPIQRYKFYQSKLTEEVAHTLFAPVFTWYYNDGITPCSCDSVGNPLVSESEQPKNSGTVVTAYGGTTNISWKVGIGMVISGVQGDAENYDPAGAGYGNIRVNTGILTVDGLTDDDIIVASKISNYGSNSVHPEFPVGTEAEEAIKQYKAMNLGLPTIYKGSDNITFNRVDEAVARILVLSPDNNPAGIDEMNYNKVVSDHNAPVYNMNGVRMNMNSLNKGVYVKQGKKFVIK